MKTSFASSRDYRILKSERSQEVYTRSCVLSRFLEVRGLFLSEEILAPGRRSSAPHFHSLTDEVVYVVRGRMTAVEGESEIPLASGDALSFARGSGTPHFFRNDSGEDCVFLLARNLAAADAVFENETKGI